MKWWYEGFNVGGQVSSGEFLADSMEDAAEILRSKGIYPQQIKQVGVEEIKPVLPQKQTAAFEEELGFIDTKKVETKEAETKKPEVVAAVSEKEELEETQAVVQEKPPVSACGSCCGCASAKVEEEKDAEYYLKKDLEYLMDGFAVMVGQFTKKEDTVEQREKVIGNLSGVVNDVMKDLLHSYVLTRRHEEFKR